MKTTLVIRDPLEEFEPTEIQLELKENEELMEVTISRNGCIQSIFRASQKKTAQFAVAVEGMKEALWESEMAD